MISVAVEEALNAEIVTLGYTVQFPNLDYTPTNDIFLRVSYLSSQSEFESYGSNRERSIIQIDCVDVPDIGAIRAATAANEVKALFPLNRVIQVGSERIKIDREVWAGPRLNDNQNSRYFIPVNVPFEVTR